MAKTPKSKPSKSISKKEVVDEQPIVVASINPEVSASLEFHPTPSTPVNLGHRLRPQNLVSELDSILERLAKLEELISKK